jgi:hypothetical protein
MRNLGRVSAAAVACLLLLSACRSTRHFRSSPAAVDAPSSAAAASPDELAIGRAGYEQFAADPERAPSAGLYFGDTTPSTRSNTTTLQPATARRC